MVRQSKRIRTSRPSLATRAPSPTPSPSPSPSLSAAPSSPAPTTQAIPDEAAAVFDYLKAQGFTSTLDALKAELASAAASRASRSHLSASSLFWNNDDIATEVCSFLGQSDLRTCLTLSRAFNRAAAPLLYRRLPVRHHNCYCRPLPDRDQDLVSRHTTALELFPHQHVQHYRVPLDVPRLRTLVINYDPEAKSEMSGGRGSALYSCRECPSKPPVDKAERVVVRPIAGLFKGKKPATLIVVPTSRIPGNFASYTSPNTISPVTVVHIARMTSQTKYTRSCWTSPREPLLAPTRSITFVVLPLMWDHGPVSKRRLPWGEANRVGNLGGSLIQKFCEYALNFGDHKIQIVGLEDANPFAMPEHWAARHERREVFEKAFFDKFDSLTASGFSWRKWTDEQRASRRETITLTTFNDYLRSGEWGEEMDWQLVGRWLNTYDLREKGMFGTLARKPKRAAKKAGKKRKLSSLDDEADSDDQSADPDFVA